MPGGGAALFDLPAGAETNGDVFYGAPPPGLPSSPPSLPTTGAGLQGWASPVQFTPAGGPAPLFGAPAARPRFGIPFQSQRAFGASVIDMKYGEHDPALNKGFVGGYLDEARKIKAQEAAYFQGKADPDLTATARPYLRSLPPDVVAGKGSTSFIELGTSTLQGAGEHDHGHHSVKKRANAWRQAHGNTRRKSSASSSSKAATKTAPGSSVGNSGRNPFYVVHGGYEVPRRSTGDGQTGRGASPAEGSSVSRFKGAGALLEAASQRSEQGLAQMLGRQASAAASSLAGASQAPKPPSSPPQWLSMPAFGGETSRARALQPTSQLTMPQQRSPRQNQLQAQVQSSGAVPQASSPSGGAMRFRGSMATQSAATVQNGVAQPALAGFAGSAPGGGAAQVVQRVLQPIIIQQPVPQAQQPRFQVLQPQQQQQPQQQPQIIILQQPPLQQPSASAQSNQLPRFAQVVQQPVAQVVQQPLAQQPLLQQLQQPVQQSVITSQASRPVIAGTLLEQAARAVSPQQRRALQTAPVSMLTPLGAQAGIRSRSARGTPGAAKFHQALHPRFSTPFKIPDGPAPPLPHFQTFSTGRFKETAAHTTRTKASAALAASVRNVEAVGLHPPAGGLAVVQTPMGSRIGFGSGAQAGSSDMRFRSQATPGFPDAVGSMHIPAQVRQHLVGAPVPPQALYPPTSPPPPALIDQPPLPGQA